MKKRDDLNICDEPLNPDKEIIAWERWIKIRKDETENLGAKIGRPPADLAMNILERIREDNERKTVLEHAQIDKKPSIRGTLWEQPNKLKQGCYCEPVYEMQRTKAELGRPRVVEHVGVPLYIQKTEKGLTGTPKRKTCTLLDADYYQYREKREKDLHSKILKIDPYKPDINELIIIGSKPTKVQKTNTLLPEVIISSEIPPEPVIESIYAIQINKTIFFKTIPGQNLLHLIKLQKEHWHETCNSWSYYFNTPAKRAGRAKLYLKNIGTVTLKYCWKKIKVSIPFVPEDLFDQVFFFNKNEDVLYPGQSKEIYFTFLSDKPGIYNEGWELCFSNICFFDTLKNKFVITLSADSTENIQKIKRNSLLLQSSVYGSVLKILVRSFLEEIIAKAVSKKHQIYPYKYLFLEAELFEMKNPVCYYHQTEVGKMKDLYSEMVPGAVWDLSITSWRLAMMNHEFDTRMVYYELLRKSHSDLLKPWYEGEDLMKQKYRTIMILLGQLADKFDQEYARLHEIFGVNNLTINTELDDITVTSKTTTRQCSVSLNPTTLASIRNTFYMHAYEHMATTIEMCAGALSSLDLNRWIHFDFCRM